jgi:hypothetical protein
MAKLSILAEAKSTWMVRCLFFNFVNGRYRTLFLFFKMYALFDGVVDLREASSSKGSPFQSSFGLTPHISQKHMDYSRMQEELRAMQDELVAERETNRATRDSWLLTMHRCNRLWW